jgi:membrane protease YdiL (CAAX protease family)
MDIRRIFINDFGRLRSGWRVLIFAAAFLALFFIVITFLRVAYAIALAVAPPLRSNFVADVIFRLSILISALGAGYLCARFLEGLPWRSLGLTRHAGWFRDLLFGCAVGFAALVVAVAIAAGANGLHFSLNGVSVASIVRSALSTASLLLAAALAEEATFRGYGLQTLIRGKLVWLGVFLTSVPFGLVHLFNPNVVPVFTLANTILAGLLLSVAYLKTRSLWLPLGIHWLWNWTLGWVFGLPISGLKLVSYPLLQATDTGPDWLTGGSYGIEGGFACTVALTLFTVFIWRTSLISATPEMQKLTSEENPALPSPVLTIRPVDDHA